MRYGSGLYLCRYRGCPCAIQGFNSPNLRQEHEDSHAPLFRCNDAECEAPVKCFKSRAAMNKHNKKYHDDKSLATIPTSLHTGSARPQQDRLRFLLREPSSNSLKRSSYVVEDEDQTRDCIIKCICGFTTFEDGDFFKMLNCDSCNTAQHFRCYYTNEHGELLKLERHFCIDCEPRPIDVEMATTRQMERKNRHSEYLHLREMMEKETIERPAIFHNDMLWSGREEESLRTLICHLGTNWEAIAKDMNLKGHEMVCNS